jgi:hypothetical protein
MNGAKIKPLAEARREHRKYYFTGRKCVRGHIAKRETASRACTVCRHQKIEPPESYRARYLKTRAKRLKAARKYYRANRERILTRVREYERRRRRATQQQEI